MCTRVICTRLATMGTRRAVAGVFRRANAPAAVHDLTEEILMAVQIAVPRWRSWCRSPTLRRRDLTVDRLATLMSALTGPDRSFRSYAGEIAAERGAAVAADHIIAHLHRTTSSE